MNSKHISNDVRRSLPFIFAGMRPKRCANIAMLKTNHGGRVLEELLEHISTTDTVQVSCFCSAPIQTAVRGLWLSSPSFSENRGLSRAMFRFLLIHALNELCGGANKLKILPMYLLISSGMQFRKLSEDDGPICLSVVGHPSLAAGWHSFVAIRIWKRSRLSYNVVRPINTFPHSSG
jgi:hypothetical protein